MSLLYRVFAAFASRDSELARPGARLPSHNRDARARNSNSKHEQEADQSENATQYVRRLIYRLASVRQRKGRFPGQMPNSIP